MTERDNVAAVLARSTIGRRSSRFAQVDVFSPEPQGGNPVAVVLDGEGLSDDEMQRFARWTNLSETTFLLAPAEGGDYRVRIFTPDRELPFAGHPTLGSCHAWLDGDVSRDEIVQECAAGKVRLRRTDGRLAFAAPPMIRYEPVGQDTRDEVVSVLGIGDDEVVDIHWADNGPGWVAVLLDSPERVLALTPGRTDLDIGVAAFRDDDALEVRAFFPVEGVVLEDPVTGSLQAGLARWLIDTGRIEPPYVARQGTAIGRAGRVHVERDAEGTIWVGGHTTTVVEGSAWLG